MRLIEIRGYMDGGTIAISCFDLHNDVAINIQLNQIMDLSRIGSLDIPGALYFNMELVPVRDKLERSILQELGQVQLTELQLMPMERWLYESVKKSNFGIDLNLFWSPGKSVERCMIDELIVFVNSDRYSELMADL